MGAQGRGRQAANTTCGLISSAAETHPHSRASRTLALDFAYDFWPHNAAPSLHPPDAPWRPEHNCSANALKRGRQIRPFAWNPAWGCRRGERTRCVFLPAPPSLDFQATPHKVKEPVVLFCLLLHVPFRLEAVIKILTFGIFLFPYVLILIESSDALPFCASSPVRVML